MRTALLLCIVMLTATAGCRKETPAPRPMAASQAGAPPATAPASGPGAARAFNGHWYKAVDRKVSWHEAKRLCEAMGGYLACIESEDEQRFIATLAGGRYLYLGATDEGHEGAWEWGNGVPFTYTCWMKGQPNNYGGAENCLATYTEGQWVDVADEGDGFWMPTGFLCEWDHAPKPQQERSEPD